jgi:hypothetical protein
MSANFNNIVSLINSNTKANSSSYPIAEKVIDINLALDKVWDIILPNMGTWQLDDSNQTDYPIITTDLVSGQRDYSFVTDEQGNLILDIYKVMIADENGVYSEIFPVDVQSQSETSGFYDGQNKTGKPSRYDKTANGIFLDLIPSYNYTNGLKIYINREASYFTVADTTKKPGFAGIYHEYLALRPSYQYAYRNNLANVQRLENEMVKMRQAIIDYYGTREKDVKKRFLASVENCK